MPKRQCGISEKNCNVHTRERVSYVTYSADSMFSVISANRRGRILILLCFLALDRHNFMDMLVASTFYDNSCELASCDAGRIDTHAVFLDSKTFVGIVTIEDCSPLVF